MYQMDLESPLERVNALLTCDVPDYGPGDKVLVPNNGVQEVIIDRIVSMNHEMRYECHTNTLIPTSGYYLPEEVYDVKERMKCRQAWEKLEAAYASFNPKEIGIDKFAAYDIVLSKPWQGKHTAHVVYAVLKDGQLYSEDLGDYVHTTVTDKDPYEWLDKMIKKINSFAKENKSVLFENHIPEYKIMFKLSDKEAVEWDKFSLYQNDLHHQRVNIKKAI